MIADYFQPWYEYDGTYIYVSDLPIFFKSNLHIILKPFDPPHCQRGRKATRSVTYEYLHRL